MKLEFEQKIIPEGLYKELDFDSYLSLFCNDLSLISSKILRPMKSHEGERYLDQINVLEKLIEEKQLALDEIILVTRKLINLDSLLSYFENKNLELFHLHQLGSFLLADATLERYEVNFPVPHTGNTSLRIQEILEKYTENQFARFHFEPDEETLKIKIQNHEAARTALLAQYERNIHDETGIKMIYPYPKEISLTSPLLPKIKKTSLLKYSIEGDHCRIDYVLPEKVRERLEEIEKLSRQFEQLNLSKLAQINEELFPFYADFAVYFQERKNRVYYYSLLWAKKKNNLVFAEFTKDYGISLKGGNLPALSKQLQKSYIPLDFTLSRGANVLLGANMAGKTTVLKTIYFLLTCARMGLPVPANSFKLHFPEQVEFHLKSSGDIKQNISSFGEELMFFAKKWNDGAYVLADELFQSTNPVSGIELSKIFLEDFSDKNLHFFCTSLYPETIRLKNVSLFRMRDIDIGKLPRGEFSLDQLMGKQPYKIEKISSDGIEQAIEESKKPLLLALHFPLPEHLKERIRNFLKA